MAAWAGKGAWGLEEMADAVLCCLGLETSLNNNTTPCTHLCH